MKTLLFLASLSFVFIEHFFNKMNVQNFGTQIISLEKTIDKLGDKSLKGGNAKTAPENINEVLWLKKKYNIVRIRLGCVVSEEDILTVVKQENEIFLKYGNTFWQRISEEVALIEKNNLGYKKAKLKDLEKHLKRNNCTIKVPQIGYDKFVFARVYFKLDEDGKIINIQLNTEGYAQIHFGKDNCAKFEANLIQILTKMRLCEPSTFLNKGIEDNFGLEITQLK